MSAAHRRPPGLATLALAICFAVPCAASPGLPSTPETRPDARVFDVSIPAPRGRILDRTGIVLANSAAVQQLALRFPTLAGADDDPGQVVRFARARLAEAQAIPSLAASASLPDDETLRRHYRHRRWLALPISANLTPAQIGALRDAGVTTITPGLTLLTSYQRRYPRGWSAAHVIGYVRRERPLETGPMIPDEPLFENVVGVSGLEKSFDSELSGTPGRVRFVVAADGSVLAQDIVDPAIPGDDVVTAINFRLQELAENVLSRRTKRGAVAVVDAGSGDVLALASWPSFDLNAFVPSISQARFDALAEDPASPLFPRAFAGQYPPASAFKTVVALGALASDAVTTRTKFDTPVTLTIDGREFKNWNLATPEGEMAVSRALARSSNTWFYQAGLAAGPGPVLAMARQLGFGTPTGISLPGEPGGQLPELEEVAESPQAIANLSIGQGTVLATPLQMALATATIANGTRRYAPRLVLQVQDERGRVVRTFPASVAADHPFALGDGAAVREGMYSVINTPYGSAHDNQLGLAELYGKTGTAQWGEHDGHPRYLAWFIGFLENKNPQLAFSAVYEGNYGEAVEGHLHGAPIMVDILRTALVVPEDFGVALPTERRVSIGEE